MRPSTQDIEEALKDYAKGIFGTEWDIHAHTKICKDLGLYDEDLWEMIDAVLEMFRIAKPTTSHPANIPMKQDSITFENLAVWIHEYCKYS